MMKILKQKYFCKKKLKKKKEGNLIIISKEIKFMIYTKDLLNNNY